MFIEEQRSEEDRTKYTLAEFTVAPKKSWKRQVEASDGSHQTVPFFFERRFRPTNGAGLPVGRCVCFLCPLRESFLTDRRYSENMRFKMEAE